MEQVIAQQQKGIAGLGVIVKNKKVLLAQRSHTCNIFPLRWCFPGGRGEKGETPKQTAIREVQEEVGLELTDPILWHEDHYGERVCSFYLGEASGTIQIQESEVSSAKEFTYEETKELEMAFNHKELIEKLHREGYL